MILPNMNCVRKASGIKYECQPKCNKLKIYRNFEADLSESFNFKEYNNSKNTFKKLRRDLLPCIQDLASICKILKEVFSDISEGEFEDVSEWKRKITEASRLLESDSVTEFFATKQFTIGKVVNTLNNDLTMVCKEKVKIKLDC